jgi:hypothetical protein
MLIKYSELKNSVMQATDGEIGRCKDFLYDDRDWNVRCMVADTHKWLPGRKIILAPGLLEQPVWEERRLPVKLTREQIESQPPLKKDPPLIRKIAQQGWIRFVRIHHDRRA